MLVNNSHGAEVNLDFGPNTVRNSMPISSSYIYQANGLYQSITPSYDYDFAPNVITTSASYYNCTISVPNVGTVTGKYCFQINLKQAFTSGTITKISVGQSEGYGVYSLPGLNLPF